MIISEFAKQLEYLEDDMWQLLVLERDLTLAMERSNGVASDEIKCMLNDYHNRSNRIFGIVRTDRRYQLRKINGKGVLQHPIDNNI